MSLRAFATALVFVVVTILRRRDREPFQVMHRDGEDQHHRLLECRVMDNQWEIIRNLDSMTIRELLDLLRQTTLLPIRRQNI
jgi:hypothetical protein